MKQRFLTAICIIAVVLPPLVFGGWMMDLLMLFCVVSGAVEITNCLKAPKKNLLRAVMILVMLGLSVLPSAYFAAGLALTLVLLFTAAILDDQFDLNDVTLIFSMMTVFVMAVRSILAIYDVNSRLMLFVILATYMTDTGAYFFGYFFGKHKLVERISPKKTIEGSVGGWVLGTAVSFAFAWFMIPSMNPGLALFAAATMSVIGQIGDLAFSMIKRHVGIKDYGSIFPGHGGVLDRIDSLLFNLLYFTIILTMVV